MLNNRSILLLSKYGPSEGAGKAASRLYKGLLEKEINARLAIAHYVRLSANKVYVLNKSLIRKISNRLMKVLGRLLLKYYGLKENVIFSLKEMFPNCSFLNGCLHNIVHCFFITPTLITS